MSLTKTREQISYENSVDTGSEYIYYNYNLVNNGTSPVAVSFIDTLNNAILTNGREYYLSVVRFVLDGSVIPIKFFPSTPNYYVVTLIDANANFYQASVNYSPNVNNENTLYQSQATIYTYQQFLNCINITLNQLFDTLFVANGGPLGPYANEIPPFFFWNRNTSTCQFYAPMQSQYKAGSTNNSIRYFMNANLYELFDNYPGTIYYNNATVTTQKFNQFCDYEIVFNQDIYTLMDSPINKLGLNPNNAAPYNGCNSNVPLFYQLIDQEYPNSYLMFDITTIKFRSASIGVSSEYTPGRNTSTTELISGNTGNAPPSTSMITDFQPYFTIGDPAGPRGYNYFAVQGEWRMSPLEKDIINKMDLDIVLVDKLGNEYPYYLPIGQSLQIKIAFVRKDCHGK